MLKRRQSSQVIRSSATTTNCLTGIVVLNSPPIEFQRSISTTTIQIQSFKNPTLNESRTEQFCINRRGGGHGIVFRGMTFPFTIGLWLCKSETHALLPRELKRTRTPHFTVPHAVLSMTIIALTCWPADRLTCWRVDDVLKC